MPLILDPGAISVTMLEELRRALRDDLEETRQLVERPGGPVLDSAGLEAADDLLRSALARMDLPSSHDPATLAADVNFAYATMVAVIDLVKSHTDVPRVPKPRSRS